MYRNPTLVRWEMISLTETGTTVIAFQNSSLVSPIGKLVWFFTQDCDGHDFETPTVLKFSKVAFLELHFHPMKPGGR